MPAISTISFRELSDAIRFVYKFRWRVDKHCLNRKTSANYRAGKHTNFAFIGRQRQLFASQISHTSATLNK